MNRFVNPGKLNPYKFSIDDFSDKHSPMFAGVAKAYLGDDNVWVGDLKHKGSGNDYLNSNKCEVVFYNNEDMQHQDYFNHPTEVVIGADLVLSDLVPVILNIDSSNRIELSSRRYNRLYNESADSDKFKLIDNALVVDIAVSGGTGILNTINYSVWPGVAYYTVYNSDGELIDRSLYTTISNEKYTSIEYLGAPNGDYEVTILFNQYPQSYINTTVYDNKSATSELSIIDSGYLNNKVYATLYKDGETETGEGTTYIELFEDGEIVRSKINKIYTDSEIKRIDNNPVINNWDKTDMSKITYHVSDSMVNEVVVEQVDTIGDNILGISPYVEMNRRATIDTLTEPYVTTKNLSRGALMKYVLTDTSGDTVTSLDYDDVACMKISADRSFHDLLQYELNKEEYNTDILETITISGATGVDNGTDFTNFSDVTDRMNFSMMEKIGSEVVYFNMGAEPGTETFFNTVSFPGDANAIELTHNLDTELIMIEAYTLGGVKVVPAKVQRTGVNTIEVTMLEPAVLNINIVKSDLGNSDEFPLTGGTDSITHNFNSTKVGIQVFDASGVVHYPTNVDSSDSNVVVIDSNVVGTVVVFKEVPITSKVIPITVSGITSFTNVHHGLFSNEVSITVYDNAGNKILPENISIVDNSLFDIDFGDVPDGDYTIYAVKRFGADEYYTDNKKIISGMGVSNGKIVVYTSNFTVGSGVSSTLYPAFSAYTVDKASGRELIRPLVKISSANGNFKITGVNRSLESLTDDTGLVSIVYNIEAPFAPGVTDFLNGYTGDPITSTVKIVTDIIEVGSSALVGGRSYNSSKRYIPEMYSLMIMSKNNLDDDVVEFDNHTYAASTVFEYVNNNSISVVDDHIEVGSVDGGADYTLQIATSGKGFRSGNKTYPYIGRENPTYEFTVDLSTLNPDETPDFINNCGIPGIKRWLKSLAIGGGRVDGSGVDAKMCFEIYDNDFKLSKGAWIPLTDEIAINSSTMNKMTSDDYIDYLTSSTLIKDDKIRVRFRIKNDSTYDSNWETETTFDWETANYTTHVDSISATYFKLSSV